jgi:hypothetical protein
MSYVATWLQSSSPNLESLSIYCEEVGPEPDPDFDLRAVLEQMGSLKQTSFQRWRAVDDAFRDIQLPLLQKVRLMVHWRDWEYPQPHRIREVMHYLAVQRNILEIVDMNSGWIRNAI